MGLKIRGGVERVNGKELSYDEFVERFMAKNKPVILSGLMEDWRACRDWVLEDGKPNLQFFSTNFGNSRVQVAECGTKDFTDQKRLEMSVSEFIDHWLETSAVEGSCFSTTEFKSRPLLYLKDWHFVTEYPEYSAYMTPLIFRDDWLNLYLDQYHMHTDPSSYQEANEISCSDYRFVYMGTKGTWTPLHADVFRSHSWSANVCGKKQWYFLSPDQQHLVFDRYKKHSVYDIFEEVTKEKFPGFKEAMWLECIQGQNEIIFVPSGWYHQVHNLEDTISINHNWFNGYNLQWVWDLLLRDYNEAKEYIEDVKDFCDDFEGLCQRNLAANTGMNFYDFFIFVVRVSYVNMVQLYHLARRNSCKMWSSSQRARHIIFNLQSVKSIALKMKSTCLAKNDTFSTDIVKASEDPTILELCTRLERTYVTIHNKCELINETEDNLADGSGDMGLCGLSSSLIKTPQDLVSFIDRALLNLGIFPPKKPMVSGIDSTGSTTAL